MKYFEDFTVGENFSSDATYTVTEEEIREVGERWDPQPIHVDSDAAELSMFGGLVASSVHLFAIHSAIANSPTAEPHSAVSALGFDKIRMHAPTRPGDVLSVRSTVLECRPSNSRPNLGIVRSHSELLNQDGEVVFALESAALFERHP